MTHEQENELIEIYQKSSEPDPKIEETFYFMVMPLIVRNAQRMAFRDINKVDSNIVAGFLAVRPALRKYDTSYGNRFIAYFKSQLQYAVAQEIRASGYEKDFRNRGKYRFESLDSLLSEDREDGEVKFSSHANLRVTSDVHEQIHEETVKTNIAEALECLTERERRFVKLRFEDNFTLEEIGGPVNLSKERVRQIIVKACDKLKLHRNIRVLNDFG